MNDQSSDARSSRDAGASNRTPGWFFLAGLLLRLGSCLLVDYACQADAGDAGVYRLLASHLLKDNTFSLDGQPTLFRAPGYPLLLAAWGSFTECNLWASLLLQLGLNLLSILLLYRLARRVAPAAAGAFLPMALLCPLDWFYWGRLLSENLCAFLLSAALAAFLLLRGRARALWSALCLSLLALTRDVYLPLAFGLPLAAAYLAPVSETGARRKLYGNALLSLLLTSLCLLPWGLRNYCILGQPVVVSRGLLGFNLWVGSWERNGSWQDPNGLVFPDEAFGHVEDAVRVRSLVARGVPLDQCEDEFKQLAWKNLRERPGFVISRWFARLPRPWLGSRTELLQLRLDRGSLAWTAFKVCCWSLDALLLLLAGVGAVLVWRDRSPLRLLLVAPIYTAAVYFPLHNCETRFTQPLLLSLLLLAAVGWVRMEAKRKGAVETRANRADSPC